MAQPYPALQVDFNNAVTTAERTQISAVCLTFRNNTQVLRDTRCNQATVYRLGLLLHKPHLGLVDLYLSRGGTWWHTSPDDTRLHVTVRYNRYSARRCHVYQDGTGTIRPPNVAPLRTAPDEEGSDWSAEFSDREDDEEIPEPVGN